MEEMKDTRKRTELTDAKAITGAVLLRLRLQQHLHQSSGARAPINMFHSTSHPSPVLLLPCIYLLHPPHHMSVSQGVRKGDKWVRV